MKAAIAIVGTVVTLEFTYGSHDEAIAGHDMMLNGLRSGYLELEIASESDTEAERGPVMTTEQWHATIDDIVNRS